MADTAVARAGQPGMGVASCFGSPLLNDVLGFSVALIVRAVLSFALCLTIFPPPNVYHSIFPKFSKACLMSTHLVRM